MLADMQHRCMTRAFEKNDRMLDFFVRKPEDEADCCAWRFTRCTENAMTTLVYFKPRNTDPFHINVAWFPQTLQFVRLVYPKLVSFSVRQIPRDSRLFQARGSRFVGAVKSDVLNLAELPERIEELNIDAIGTNLHFPFATVVIPSLPETLRLCFIQSARNPRTVYVCNTAIPEGLEQMIIRSDDAKAKCEIKALDGRKVDKRISNKRNVRLRETVEALRYPNHCIEVIEEFQSEVNQIFASPGGMISVFMGL